MAVKHVQWLGDGPISFPLPGHATVYTLKPKIRNVIDGDVWKALIDPRNGPALPYLKARKLRVTTPGGGADEQETAAVGRSYSPSPPAPMPAADDKLAVENSMLKAQLAKLEARFAKMEELEAAAGDADEPDAADSGDEPEAEDPEADLPDPGSLSVAKLGGLIEGLEVFELEDLLERERAGKNRSGAVDLLSHAIAKAAAEGDED